MTKAEVEHFNRKNVHIPLFQNTNQGLKMAA